MNATPDEPFEALLAYLRDVRGFDFTGYKRPSLMRRTERRMQELGVPGFTEYQDYLEVHPDEFATLFDRILINVTEFFRDKQSWEILRNEVIPALVARSDGADPIRVWSAGCATGQEAYGLAIAFGEALGVDALRERVKIYATDLDDDALATARRAIYSAEDVAVLGPEIVEKYFEKRGAQYAFRADLRRWIIFGKHDLLTDAPMARLDLLVCRNTMMYFNSLSQGKILSRMHYALRTHGVLFLGRAEMLLSHSALFTPLNLKHRLFRKVPDPEGLAFVPVQAQVRASSEDNETAKAALDALPLAQLIVDVAGNVIGINRRAMARLGLQPGDIGRPFHELEISYKPAELRSPMEQARDEGKPVVVRHIERITNEGSSEYFDVTINPLRDARLELIGVSISFTDTTEYEKMRGQHDRATVQLAQANEDLMATNEELETTNEELQSTVEELETTNEEVQSTNEELETLNEEMQSTNSELQALNDELHDRSTALDSTNVTLRSILASLRGAVIVVDTAMQILLWSPRAEDLWGVRAEEVIGHRILDVDFGFPVESLHTTITACLNRTIEQDDSSTQATNRRGKLITCDVRCAPLIGPRGKVNGVVILMEEAPPPPARRPT